MKFLLMSIFIIYSVKCEELDFDIDFPKLEEVNTEPEFTYIGEIDGCTFQERINVSVICKGLECEHFPNSMNITTNTLKVKATSISVIRKNDFHLYSNLHTLLIEFNLDLILLESGCFANLSQLVNMSLSFNQNLRVIDENLFKGLVSLKELYVNKNGFSNVIDITKALSPNSVPVLTHLHMNENLFRMVLKDDFKIMTGSVLEELQMALCQIEHIDPESFIWLKKLKYLHLGQNQFLSEVIENVLNKTIQYQIPLKLLDLFNAGFRRKPPIALLELVAKTNITHFSLGRNTFDNLNEVSFPKMPHIVALDLSYCLLLDVAVNTFKNMPNLKTLLLNGNRLPSVSRGIVLQQLKKLDISGNSGNPISRSYFRVDDNIFINMTSMTALQMSNNLISQISASTFNGLNNLQYLGLKNATIFGIEYGAFRHMKHLQYLNLENNQITMTLNAEMFKGMDELKILLLGGCALDNLYSVPSPFLYLPNLTYLGLERNSLYTLQSIVFPNNLKTLDLSLNKLTEWYEHNFVNLTLDSLDVSQNKFKTLTETMLEDFSNLKKLNLEGNPFSCDCSIYPAANRFKKNNLTLKNLIYDDFNAKCVNPDEWGQTSIVDYMKYLENNPKQCEFITFTKTTLISVIIAVFIFTIISSVLAYVYRLHLRHWILLIKMGIRRYYRRKTKFNSETNTFKYDAFVSYSNEDQEFVINLVTKLENNEPHLKLCVYERDFQIGCNISESVLESVASSRKTLLIISDAFAKSQWCRWEAKLAEHHHLFFKDGDITGPGTLLIILLNTVSETNMTPTLKYLLKTRIYLEWTSEPEKQTIFWDRLKKKLSTPNNELYDSSMTIIET